MARRDDMGLAGSAGGAGGIIPPMRTYPPSGIALRPYSVSPRLTDHSVFPKPTMYWVQRIPNSLAGTRCPSSCQAIENSRPRIMRTIPSTVSNATMYVSSSLPGDELLGPLSGPVVGFVDVFEPRHSPSALSPVF